MATRYDRDHIDISDRKSETKYTSTGTVFDAKELLVDPEAHALALREQLDRALGDLDQTRPTDERIGPAEVLVLDVELRRGEKAETLEKKREGIRTGAAKIQPNAEKRVALFIPEDKRELIAQIIEIYGSEERTPKGNRRLKGFVEPINRIIAPSLETVWTDHPSRLPQMENEKIWWEAWCHTDRESVLEDLANRLGVPIAEADARLRFPEFTIVPLYATRHEIEIMLFAKFAIIELRRAMDTPKILLDDFDRDEQFEFSNDLVDRTTWPGRQVPAVCLLDTGVNRAHNLIEPALDPRDMSSIREDWGVDDSYGRNGHGTGMATLALFGDLFPRLSDMSDVEVKHRLESIKLLPPHPFPQNDPNSYGLITKQAVAIAEANNSDRARVFCLAVTNDTALSDQPTGWSAAIDQEAAGVSIVGEQGPRRLFLVSTGNVDPELEAHRLQPAENKVIEDPAQSWNAITVGAYTNKTLISEPELAGWSTLSEAGDISPHTRTSSLWRKGKAPFKPDIVMEGGNRAIDPPGNNITTPASLDLVSAGRDVDRQPLTTFNASSAATAQASRMAARLTEAFPDYWPETIRALMVHSAEWTPSMLRQFEGENGKTARANLLRRFGYGVPSFERARASAQNDLALIAQSEIQPFRYEGGSKRFGFCHYYSLPWPAEELEALAEHEVELKITLSYFIEPNPGASSSYDPYRYQSHGLRFDLQRRGEVLSDYSKATNVEFRAKGERVTRVSDDDYWRFGPDSIASGSLHCDVWRGRAIDLLSRRMLCIKPVMGWWRSRGQRKDCIKKTRYSLIVTLKAPETDIDLHIPIQNMVTQDVAVDTISIPVSI